MVSISGTRFASIFNEFSIENQIPRQARGDGALRPIGALIIRLQITKSRLQITISRLQITIMKKQAVDEENLIVERRSFPSSVAWWPLL